MTEPVYPYRKATLNDCNGHLNKRWYIVFYVWNVQKGQVVRKRDYSVNNFQSIHERRAYAKQRIKSINEILADGYKIDSANKSSNTTHHDFMTLSQALKNILKVKKLRRSSFLSYSSTVNGFLNWAAENRYSNSDIRFFDRLKAMNYIDHLLISNNLSGKTINGKISYMKAIFNELISRELINENPFVKIKKQKEIKSYQNLAYTEKEISQLKEIIEKNDPELWTFIQFIYYCYLRPTEIRSLKIEHVNLSANKIFVPAHISKNAIEAFVEIPEPFKLYLNKINFFNNKRDYLFTNKLGKQVSKNVMSYRHKIFRDKLGIDDRHTLYSWKHTGVVKAYQAGVDIKSIQKQCRHTKIDMTDNYLKSLGLDNNDAFLLKMPGI